MDGVAGEPFLLKRTSTVTLRWFKVVSRSSSSRLCQGCDSSAMATQVEDIKWLPSNTDRRFMVDGFNFKNEACQTYFLVGHCDV